MSSSSPSDHHNRSDGDSTLPPSPNLPTATVAAQPSLARRHDADRPPLSPAQGPPPAAAAVPTPIHPSPAGGSRPDADEGGEAPPPLPPPPRFPYRPTPISGTFSDGTLLLRSITAMPPYRNVSFEELRWEEWYRRRFVSPPGTPQMSREALLTTGEDARSAPGGGGPPGHGAATGRTAATAVDGDGGGRCVVCLERRRAVIFFPCKHLCACSDCGGGVGGSALATCPVCRAEISIRTEVYW